MVSTTRRVVVFTQPNWPGSIVVCLFLAVWNAKRLARRDAMRSNRKHCSRVFMFICLSARMRKFDCTREKKKKEWTANPGTSSGLSMAFSRETPWIPSFFHVCSQTCLSLKLQSVVTGGFFVRFSSVVPQCRFRDYICKCVCMYVFVKTSWNFVLDLS